MVTLVTGGTGFLGQHLLHLLVERVERPASIRVLTRAYDPRLADLGVEQVIGSLLDPQILPDLVCEVTQVYHLAGRVERAPERSTEMYRLHVDGTRNLLDALRKRKNDVPLGKIVVASTSGTVAVSREPDVIGYDDSPYADEVVGRWPYYLSKIYQEHVIDRYIREYQLPIVTLRPTLLLGPGDERESSTGDVVAFLKGEVKIVPKGGISFVDVRDVAQAFMLAMEKAAPGSKYLLGAANMTLRAFFEKLASMTEISAPLGQVDSDLLRKGTKAIHRVRKVFKARESTAFDPVSVDMASHYWYLDWHRAEEDLGWKPRTIESTLLETVDWLRENHESFRPKEPGRKRPPAVYVPKETLEYAERVRKEPDDARR